MTHTEPADNLITEGSLASAQCPPCDYSLPGACECVKEPRGLILQLTDALEAERLRAAAVSAVTAFAQSLLTLELPVDDRGAMNHQVQQLLRATYDCEFAAQVAAEWWAVGLRVHDSLLILARPAAME